MYDHMALHVSLACERPHPERKEVYVRALCRINNDYLEADLTWPALILILNVMM